MVEIRKDVHLADGVQTLSRPGALRVTRALRSLAAQAEVLPLLPLYRRTTLRIRHPWLPEGHVLSACAPWGRPDARDLERTQQMWAGLARDGVAAASVDAFASTDERTTWNEPSALLLGSTRAEACRRGRELDQWAVFEIADGRLRTIVCATQDVLHDAPLAAVHDGDDWLIKESMR
jgi:hypothetical protein